MKSTLQIPSDVGVYCREAGDILDSSCRFLIRELEIWHEDEDPAPDWEWTVNIDHSEVEALRDNLAKVVQFLRFLAAHGEHGQPVDREEASDDRG